MELLKRLQAAERTPEPLHTERKTYRVVLWGWGWEYLKNLNHILRLREAGQIETVGLTGNVRPPFKKMDGIPLVRREDVPALCPDYIFIMNVTYAEEIRNDALALGFSNDRLLPGKILGIPYFDFRKYAGIKERKISVISNDCWGGHLSASLCLEHRSPFKNLYLLDEDYLKCLKDLRHYCTEAEPVFIRWQEGGETDEFEKYPVLQLDDIYLYCNHDSDPDAAIEKWMRRRVKINWDDLFVEMRTEQIRSEKQFNAMDQFPRRICFVPYETAEPYSLQILKPDEGMYWRDAVHQNVIIGVGNVAYSLIDLLYGGNCILRSEC